MDGQHRPGLLRNAETSRFSSYAAGPSTPPLSAGSSESANTRGQAPWGKTLHLQPNRFSHP